MKKIEGIIQTVLFLTVISLAIISPHLDPIEFEVKNVFDDCKVFHESAPYEQKCTK